MTCKVLGNRPILSGAIVFLISAFYFLSYSSYGINLWDEGGLYYGGIRYLGGQEAMKDFLGYPPGRYILAETVFHIFGNEMLPLRWTIAILSALLVLFVFQISRKLMPLPYRISAVILMLSAPAVYYQRFYSFSFLFTAFAVVLFIEDRKNLFWLLLSALYAYFFKIETLIIFLPLYLFLFLQKKENGKEKKMGLAVILGLLLIIFSGKYGSELIYRFLNDYQQWGNNFPSLFEGYQGRAFNLFAFLENLLFYLPFITALLTFLVGIKSDDEKRKTTLLSLAYLQLSAMAVVIMRAGFDNLIRCLPLFFITAPFLVFHAVQKCDGKIKKPLIDFLSALLFVLYLWTFNVANGFYTGSIGAIAGKSVVIDEGRAKGIHTSIINKRIIFAVTDWIEEETKKGDSILLLPLSPIFYYLSERDNPTRYDWLLPGSLKNEGEEKNLIKGLNKKPPTLIILADIEIDNIPQRRLKGYAPLLVEWIAERYSYQGRVNLFQVWKLKK